VSDHERCCGGTHERLETKARRGPETEAIPLAGPISTTIAAYAARVRHRVGEDAVDRRARELHARASYDCWNGLSDKDQELWRHMARLDLTA